MFSEICAGIDGRNTVQQHIRQHIDDFIATKVELRDGELVDLQGRGGSYRTTSGLRQELYVDPRTGLVRINKRYRVWRNDQIKNAKRAQTEIEARRRTLDYETQLHRIDGIWFEVSIGDLPAERAREVVVKGRLVMRTIRDKRFDAVLRQEVANDEHSAERERLYGTRNKYGISKRQLSKRELDRRDLR